MDNIWNQYWLILLVVCSLVCESIRDERIDRLISYIPEEKRNKYNRFYRYSLIRYGRSSIEKNKFWLLLITGILFFTGGILNYIGFSIIAGFVCSLMFVAITVCVIFPLEETLIEYKFRFSGVEKWWLSIFSLLILLSRIEYSAKIEILDLFRVLGLWFTFWMITRYVPLKACSASIWLIKYSKKSALKEAGNDGALRNFLRFIIVLILGLCIDKANETINFVELALDCYFKWFLFLFGG